MCDEESTFTERARAWLKADEPTQEQIQSAYTRMLAKLDKQPELCNADTDECVELLISAYRGVGGSIDELLASVEAGKQEKPKHASVDAEACLDSGKLYEVSEGPVVELPPEQKRDAFLKLKAQLGGMRLPDKAGPSGEPSVF